jgi:hypothetical protein
MEKEYYYMFSSGEYSNYCVGGMYKSKEKFDESSFAEYLRQMIIDQIVDWPEAVDCIKNINRETTSALLTMLSSEYTVSKHLFQLVAGKMPDFAYEKPAYMSWVVAFNVWKESIGEIDVNFIKSLVKEGRLEEIEYEEIWNG